MVNQGANTESDGPVADLRRLIGKREVVAIIGTGVSLAVTRRAPTASWEGLLKNGIQHCQKYPPRMSQRWAQRQCEALDDAIETGDLVEMLGVAEQVANRLDAPDGGEKCDLGRSRLSAGA
jgi:hypothetical protein